MTRVSYNDGNGGINARPTAEEESFAHGRHFQATSVQTQNIQAARGNAEFHASVNRKPAGRGDRKSGRVQRAALWMMPAERGVAPRRSA